MAEETKRLEILAERLCWLAAEALENQTMAVFFQGHEQSAIELSPRDLLHKAWQLREETLAAASTNRPEPSPRIEGQVPAASDPGHSDVDSLLDKLNDEELRMLRDGLREVANRVNAARELRRNVRALMTGPLRYIRRKAMKLSPTPESAPQLAAPDPRW